MSSFFFVLLVCLLISVCHSAKKKQKESYYDKLDVSPEATIKEIKKAYANYALKNHPDKDPQSSEEKRKAFQDVTKAYEVLSDPEKKERYDKHLQWGEVEYDEARYENFAEKLYQETDDEKAERLKREEELEKKRREEIQQAQEHSELIIKSIFILLLVGVLGVMGFQYFKSQREIKERHRATVESKKREKEKQAIAEIKVQQLQKKTEERSKQEIRKRKQKASNYQEQDWQKAEIDDSIYDNLYERTDLQENLSADEVEEETPTIKDEIFDQNSETSEDSSIELEGEDRVVEPSGKINPTKKDKDQQKNQKPSQPTKEMKKVQTQTQAKAKVKAVSKQNMYCPACKKPFKTVAQWENHVQSKKHQQTVFQMKKAGLLTDADLPTPPSDSTEKVDDFQIENDEP